MVKKSDTFLIFLTLSPYHRYEKLTKELFQNYFKKTHTLCATFFSKHLFNTDVYCDHVYIKFDNLTYVPMFDDLPIATLLSETV